MKLKTLFEADVRVFRTEMKPNAALVFSIGKDGIRVTPRDVSEKATVPEGIKAGLYFRTSPDGRFELISIHIDYLKALAQIRKGLRRVPDRYNVGQQSELTEDDLEYYLEQLTYGDWEKVV